MAKRKKRTNDPKRSNYNKTKKWWDGLSKKQKETAFMKPENSKYMKILKDGKKAYETTQSLPEATVTAKRNNSTTGAIAKTKPAAKGDSFLENAVELVDPTGITSWDDVGRAWGDGKFDYNDVLEPAGALPIIGKIPSVLSKGTKGVLNGAKAVGKAVQKYRGTSDLKHATEMHKVNKYLPGQKAVTKATRAKQAETVGDDIYHDNIKPKMANGGFNPANALGAMGTLGGAALTGFSQRSNGTVNAPMAAMGGAASMAMKGAAFGPIGAIAGGAVGAITGAMGASKQNKAINDQRRKQAILERKLRDDQSRMTMATYPTNGVTGTVRHYEYGGINHPSIDGTVPPIVAMPTRMAKDGAVIPLASNAVQVKGKTHAEGGIDAGNVEVEDEEVKVGMGDYDVWFSNKLKADTGKTFADEAKDIMKKKGKAEAKMQSKDKAEQNTGKRQAEIAEQKIANLTTAQMTAQDAKGVGHYGQPKAEFGAVLESMAPALPYVDNIVNAGLTAATPQIPKPHLYSAASLDTRFNINPQVDEMRRGFQNVTEGLSRSTSNSTVLRNNMIAASIGQTTNMNNLYATKENRERELRNQDALNRQSINNSNIDKVNGYNANVARRTDDIHQKISANVADATNNSLTQLKDKRLRDKDMKELELLKLKYKASGVMDRNMEDTFESYLNGEISYEEFKRRTAMKEEQANARKSPSLEIPTIKPLETVSASPSYSTTTRPPY